MPIPVKKFVDQMRTENIRMRNLRRRDKKKYRRLAIQHHAGSILPRKTVEVLISVQLSCTVFDSSYLTTGFPRSDVGSVQPTQPESTAVFNVYV